MGGAGWRRQEDVPLSLTWPWAWSLSRRRLRNCSSLCFSLPETHSPHTLLLPQASPAGFLLLQPSGLLSVKGYLGESDPTFPMLEISQIAPASTVTLKCKTDKICLSLPKTEGSHLFQVTLTLAVLMLSDFAASSAALHAAKSSEEPRSWGTRSSR